MKFKNIRRWKQDSDLAGLLFFAQRMDELLWDYSLDTYKPATLNAPFICREAIDLIENIDAQLIDVANLAPVMEELNWSIQNDPIAKSLLDLPAQRYTSYDEGNLHQAKLMLEVLGRSLDSYRYLHACYDFLCEAVAKCKKKDIDFASRAIVTTLLNLGVSKRLLYEKNHDFFFCQEGPEIAGLSALESFLKEIYPLTHEFKVYFIVSDVINEVRDSLRPFHIEWLDSLPADLSQYAAEKDFVKTAGHEIVAVNNIMAFDAFSAQEKASGRLDRLSDLFTLFHHRRKIDWQENVLVTHCCAKEPAIVPVGKGAMSKAFDMRPDKASKELNRFLRNFSFRGASLDKFSRVSDLHGICVSTDVVENQLVNLWTALETLIPSRVSGSKILNICDSMIPFLMMSYLDGIIATFCYDLIRWKPWAVKKILRKVPQGENLTLVRKSLALLCDEENAQLRSELYAELGDFHLLRFRAFSLAEVMSCPEKIKSALDLHKRKLEWQIRRIYRTRNLIVHSGGKSAYVSSLVENGHTYLDQLLLGIMRLSCGEYRATTLEQAFEIAAVRYESFRRKLDNIEEFDSSSCQFLCDDSASLGDFVRQPWKGETHNDVSG